MQKITPCLWFNFNAEEAVEHYLRIFPNSKIVEVSRYSDAMPDHKGKVLTIRFEVAGQSLLALNGGPHYPFTEAISLSVDCADQAELDQLWYALCEGGTPGRCGWLKDKYGLSWQLVPTQLPALISGPDAARSTRVMAALLQMDRLDIATLLAA